MSLHSRSIAILSLALVTACAKPAPVLRNPQEVQTPAPDPEKLETTAAAKEGRSGSVKVKYCIDPQGRTKDITVIESLDPEVDAIVVDTVEQWRYQPATKDGQPYEFCTDYAFDLQFPAPA